MKLSCQLFIDKFIKTLPTILYSFFVISCSFGTSYLIQRGKEAEEKQDWKFALIYYEKALKELDESDELDKKISILTTVSELYLKLKDFNQAIKTLYQLRRLQRPEDFIITQIKIVRILVQYLADYDRALIEAFKTISQNLRREHYCELRYFIGFVLLQKGKFDQAAKEIQDCTRSEDEALPKQQRFTLYLLEVEILRFMKKFALASERLKFLLEQYSEFNKDHQLEMQLAYAYEENRDFDKAHQIFENLLKKTTAKSQADYIKFRLNRINYKMKTLAGARIRQKNQ